MPDSSTVFNPKVHAAVFGGAGGLALAKAAAQLFSYYFLSADTPSAVLLSWEAVFDFTFTIIGTYLGGYLKSDASYQINKPFGS
jgi:hypothetical protein